MPSPHEPRSGPDHPLRILLLSDYYSTWDIGGASRVLAEQAKGLLALDGRPVELELVSGYPGRDDLERPVAHPWHRVRYKSVPYLPRLAWLIRSRHAAFRPHLVHAHQPLAAALARLVLPRATRFVYHFHSFWMDEKLSHAGADPLARFASRLKGALERRTIARLPDCIALSEHSRSLLLGRVPGRRVTVIPGSVDTAAWRTAERPAGGPFAFLCLRRLEPRMGIDNLLRAFAGFLADSGADCRLDIVGAGRCEADLKALAASLGLGGRVAFAGRVDHARLLGLMAGSRCMVVPSRELEGFGMVVIEAFAAGLPVLATTVGGLAGFTRFPAVFQGLPDATVPSLQAGLSLAWRRFGADTGIAAEARAVAREHFDTRVVAGNLLACYDTVLSAGAASSR